MLFQVDHLSGRRGMRLVFRDIGFALEAGDALLVTGPNGSGKSSLLRVLAGLLPPWQGDARWGGESVDWAEHRRRLHYLGHHDAVKPELTVREMQDYWRVLEGSASAEALPVALGLEAHDTLPVRYLSAGQRRRLALSRLTLRDAPLWLLDEPATALDKSGQELLGVLIAAHRAKGGIAIIATHHDTNVPDAKVLTLEGGRA